MFGHNQMLKKDHGDGQTLHVVKGSPFLTIQGEGPYIGHPAVFVRLHGCHLRCYFCDTNFDDPDDPVVGTGVLLDRIMETRSMARLIVITGGEPMRQNIFPLCNALYGLGFTVQIETAGTFWIDGIEDVAEIVCSPKTPTIHPMIYEYASAFKYVISGGDENDPLKLLFSTAGIPIIATQPGARTAELASPRDGAPVYLSPMDEGDAYLNSRNRKLVALLALRHGYIAGVQLHKLLEMD